MHTRTAKAHEGEKEFDHPDLVESRARIAEIIRDYDIADELVANAGPTWMTKNNTKPGEVLGHNSVAQMRSSMTNPSLSVEAIQDLGDSIMKNVAQARNEFKTWQGPMRHSRGEEWVRA